MRDQHFQIYGASRFKHAYSFPINLCYFHAWVFSQIGLSEACKNHQGSFWLAEKLRMTKCHKFIVKGYEWFNINFDHFRANHKAIDWCYMTPLDDSCWCQITQNCISGCVNATKLVYISKWPQCHKTPLADSRVCQITHKCIFGCVYVTEIINCLKSLFKTDYYY